MEVNTWLFRDSISVVNYMNGEAVRIFTLIPTGNYTNAVKYYSKTWGAPNRIHNGKIIRLGKSPLNNPTFVWSRTNKEGKTELLEIRRFDDIRGMVPDETVGLIRLYRKNSNPIFSYLSDADLMLHRIRRPTAN
tara:strand:- start:386 stop:787 length:402 start_codon:yes stop_codon:yes gene_type:complete